MANTIENIYIEYGADTKEFTKAQQQVNKQLNSHVNYAKKLDKQFKQTFDTDDITPLVKQMEALEEAERIANVQAKKLAEELDKIDKEADDFDPIAYNKLASDLATAETKASSLNKEVQKLDKNIKAIESGNINEMSQDFQKAAKNAGVLADETAEVTESVEGLAGIDLTGVTETMGDLDTSMSGLLATAMKLPGPLKIAGVAIAGIAGAAIGASRNTDMLNQMMLQLEPTVSSVNGDLNEAVAVTNELYVATGDLEGSIAAVNATYKMYGDTLEGSLAVLTASAKNYQIISEGVIDIEAATTIATVSQEQFNATLLETNAVINESSDLISEYGAKAEDIADTFNEWSDTFITVGYSLEEFFRTMEVGLEMGARSTDEVANAINEMYIRISEGSPEAVAALEALGIPIAEAQQMLAEGQGPELMMELVTALYEVDDATTQLTYSTALFGTAGEEFIATMLAQDEKMQQLILTYDLMNAASAKTAILLGGALGPMIEQIAVQYGMTATEAANLAYQFETLGFQSLDLTGKIIVLAAGIKVNGEAMGITAEETQLLKDKLVILTDATIPASEKIKELNGEVLKFLFGGVLTEEQTAQLTQKIEDLTTKLQDQIKVYKDSGGAIEQLNQAVYNQTIATTDLASEIDYATFKSMDFTEKTLLLRKEFDLSQQSMVDLNGVYTDYSHSSKDADAKTQALKDTLVILGKEGFDVSLEKLHKVIPQINELADGFTTSSDEAGKLTGEFGEMAKGFDTTEGDLDDFIDTLKESKSAMEDFQSWARDVEDSLYGIGDAATYSDDQISDLNSALSSQQVYIPPTITAPQTSIMQQSASIPAPITNNNTTQFSPTVVVNGTGLSTSQLESVITNAFNKMWRNKGRLL